VASDISDRRMAIKARGRRPADVAAAQRVI
jgi:hypothetical protein